MFCISSFCIFGDSSPLFLKVVENIKTLSLYRYQARNSMTPKTKASILWFTMLQSRYFAAGKMDYETGMLAAFVQMSNNIKTLCPVLEHGNLPPSLYIPPSPPKSSLPPNSSGQSNHKRDPSNNLPNPQPNKPTGALCTKRSKLASTLSLKQHSLI